MAHLSFNDNLITFEGTFLAMRIYIVRAIFLHLRIFNILFAWLWLDILPFGSWLANMAKNAP